MRRVKMRGSIWRNEFCDLLAPFRLSSSILGRTLSAAQSDQDFYDDDLFVRGRDPSERAVTITMTTAATTAPSASGLPTQIERSVKSWATLGPILLLRPSIQSRPPDSHTFSCASRTKTAHKTSFARCPSTQRRHSTVAVWARVRIHVPTVVQGDLSPGKLRLG